MIRELYFVQLTVRDWGASVAWYRDVLGLEVRMAVEANRFAVLRAGVGRIALRGGEPKPGNVLLTFEVDDLPLELKRLALRGVRPAEPMKVSSEGYRRAIVLDPDGHRICLFEWDERATGA
jgi:predicted enzyme related to lactoylglutathione lyase